MNLSQALLLFGAATLAGAINSVAGGGSFFSFPALLFIGVPPVSASATNTVALWPGSVASVGAYRRELWEQRQSQLMLSITSMIGGLIGALVLVNTRDETFAALVPWLLLFATLIFTFSAPFTRWLRARRPEAVGPPSLMQQAGVALLQLVIAIYGGFFGGGIGILMLATLSLMGMDHIHKMNAIKTWLATLINGIAVIVFVVQGVVLWLPAAVMIVGAVLGGYGGAAIARQVQPQFIRRLVIVCGFVLTLYFFIRR